MYTHPQGLPDKEIIDIFFYRYFLAASPSIRNQIIALKQQRLTYIPIPTKKYCFEYALLSACLPSLYAVYQNRKKKHFKNLTESLNREFINYFRNNPDEPHYTRRNQPIFLVHYTPLLRHVFMTKKINITNKEGDEIDLSTYLLKVYFFNFDKPPSFYVVDYEGSNHHSTSFELNKTIRIAVLNSAHIIPIVKQAPKLGNKAFNASKWFTSSMIQQNDILQNKYDQQRNSLQPLTNNHLSISPITSKYTKTPNIIYWDTETRNDKAKYIVKLEKELKSISASDRKKKIQEILTDLKNKIGSVGVPVVYLIQGLWVDPQNGEDKVFWEIDDKELRFPAYNCIARFFETLYTHKYIVSTTDEKHANVMIAHNAAGFDNYFFLSWLASTFVEHTLPPSYPFFFTIDNIIQRDGLQYILFNMFHKLTKERFIFSMRDSYKFMPLSLRNIGSLFKLKQQKDVLPYELISSISDVNKYKEQIIKYGKLDVIVLKNAYDLMIKAFKKISKGMHIANFNSPTRFIRTLIYSHLFYSDPLLYPRVTPSELDKIRVTPYYYGGRTEPFKRGYIECKDKENQLSYWDFTSFYPYIISNYPMPEGNYTVVENPQKHPFFNEIDFSYDNQTLIDILNRKDPFFLHIYYKHLSTNYPPLFPYRTEAKTLIFSHFTKHSASYLIYSEELKEILENEDRFGMSFKKGKFAFIFHHTTTDYKRFIDTMFKQKADIDVKLGNKDISEAKRAWYQAYRTVIKLLINGTYGFKAQKSEVKKYILTRDASGDKEKYYKQLLDATATYFDDEHRIKMLEYKALAFTKERNIFHGIFTTNLARLQLYKLMLKGLNNNFSPIYCDTDSMIFKGGDYEDFQKAVIDKSELYSGGKTHLGGLTRESPPFEAIVVIASKIYAYRCRQEDGSIYDVIKFKGFNQNTCFSKKEILTTPEGKSYLHLSAPYSEEWFKSTNNPIYHIEFEDMVLWGKQKIDFIQVSLERFHFGMRRLDPDGFKRASITISYQGTNTKSNLGTKHDDYNDLIPFEL